MSPALAIHPDPESGPDLGHRHAGFPEQRHDLEILARGPLDQRALFGGKPHIVEPSEQILDLLGRRKLRRSWRLGFDLAIKIFSSRESTLFE